MKIFQKLPVRFLLQKTLRLFFCLLMLSAGPGAAMPADPEDVAEGWKGAVATSVITPEQSMWMSGYVSRERPSEGTLHDLKAKALALEDADGHQAVLITADIRNFPKNLSDEIRDRIERDYGLSRGQILLNSSHTHTGPLLFTDRNHVYLSSLTSPQLDRVRRYSETLVNRIVSLAGEALDNLQPVRLHAGNGVTRFQVNRRNNSEQSLHEQTELAGPNDFSVPVIKIEKPSGDLLAVVFGYACHPTVLNGYRWSGDYPGFAQLELEKTYPGTTALFFQGAGGDQNPIPRRTVALAEQYGRTLASAVSRVLGEEMRPLPAELSTAYSEVDLPFSDLPAQNELQRIAAETRGYQQIWAAHQLDIMERGETRMTEYPYPVQVWKLGDQPVISLGGELVTDYAIELKRIYGQDSFILGYSNDVMAYIPSAGILREGGYEGDTSHMVRGMPAVWDATVETVILGEVLKVAEQAGVTAP
ncbi:MAG: neutral/alkaline non-lysosomal ceramidase N-terminal domain-containing protein [Balneolaceae bacterium]